MLRLEPEVGLIVSRPGLLIVHKRCLWMIAMNPGGQQSRGRESRPDPRRAASVRLYRVRVIFLTARKRPALTS
jgi:hypothetical protein